VRVRTCAGVLVVFHQHDETVGNTVRMVYPAAIECQPVGKS